MPRQLTIQAFPTPLKIASLLRFPLQSGSLRLHPLGQNLLARLLTFAPLHSPEFFGLVSNDAEVAVYASADMVLKAVDDLCATQQEMEKWIEVTVDVWKVFQVDGEGMGGQKGESSSDQRSIIYTVTAVLAKAGISCKYQSSYYADFVLVKNEQFAETTELFQSCGWSVEDSDHTPTSQSSAQVSTRSRSPPTPRGYPSRQSTSSLPEASNEWITYYDSPAAAVTIPRRRARPHTADECVGSNEQARRGGGLRSLADCGVKRRSMSNVLDLQKDERLLAHGQELELMSVRDERPSLHKPHIGLESERVEDAILAQHDSEKQQRTVESLMVSEVVSSWSEALVEQLDSLLLDQESESGIDRAEERRPSTPSSVTIDMGADMHRSGSLMYSVFPSCPIRSSASDARFESTSSSAPVVCQLQGRIAVVGLNKETENQWEHRVQVFLTYPEEQVRVIKNREVESRMWREEAGNGSRERNASQIRSQEHTMVSKEHMSQVSLASGSSGMASRPFISYIRTREGTSLATEIPIIRSLFPNEGERDSLLQSGGELDMFDDDDSQKISEGKREPPTIRMDDQILYSNVRDPRDESNSMATASSPNRIKLDTSDSGYGSELGTAGMDVHQVPTDEPRMSHSSESTDGWKPERGVKYCLQLYCQQAEVCRGGGEQDGGSVHTDLIADISQKFSQESGLNMLYASTYHSANILIESQHVRVASRILDTVIGGFGKQATL